MVETLELNLPIEETKRVYLDYIMEISCPSCSKRLKHDFHMFPLYYPEVGRVDEISFICDYCDKTFILPLKIGFAKIKFEFDMKDLKEED